MNSYAEWLTSIPDQVSAREALVYVETALRDADEATKTIIDSFHGTVPPPPWPQHPELRTAIDAMEGGRLMLNQAIHLGYGDEKQPKTGPTGLRLQNAGKNLYREIAVMQTNMRGVSPADVAAAAARLAGRAALHIAETPFGGLLAFGAVLWAIHHFGDE